MEEDWRSQRQRDKIVQHLDTVIRNAKVPLNLPGDARKVENALYSKATNKEQYMHYVSKIIYHASNSGAAGSNQMPCPTPQPQVNQMQYAGMGQTSANGPMHHPEMMQMNEMRSMGHPQQPQPQQQHPVGQMYQTMRPMEMQRMVRPVQQGAMGTVHHMQQQGGMPVPSQHQSQNVMMLLQSGNRHPLPPPQQQQQQSQQHHVRMAQNEMQLFIQQLPMNIRQQLCQLPAEEQSEMLKKMYDTKRWQDQQQSQQQQQQQQQQRPVHPMHTGMMKPQQQQHQQQMHYIGGRPAQPMQMMQPVAQGQNIPSIYSRPPATPMPSAPTPQQQQPVPSLQQQMTSGQSLSPYFNPASQYPSLSPSGATAAPPIQPGPSPRMDTSPAVAPLPRPSPASLDSSGLPEQQGYREKIAELQIYLETLKHAIEQQQREPGPNNQLQKFQRMVEILEGRHKTTMEVLVKCEDTLKRLAQKTEDARERSRTICQPLLDALGVVFKQSPEKLKDFSRHFDHLILPALPEHKICCAERLNSLKTAVDEDDDDENDDRSLVNEKKEDTKERTDLPANIRRELALLDPKFQVTVDADSSPNTTKHILIKCSLVTDQLSSVPPLYVRVPRNYPQSVPYYDMEMSDYEGTKWLACVADELQSTGAADATSLTTITALLDNWEFSVKNNAVF